MALRWSSHVDVVADPTQMGEQGVWCRANDLLPDVSIREGQRVIASWGRELWTAIAQWDDHDPDLLWLIDGVPVERPSLEEVHPLESVIDRIVGIVGPTSGEDRRRIRELLQPIWRDTDGALNALDARLVESRRVALDVTRLLVGGGHTVAAAPTEAAPMRRLMRHAREPRAGWKGPRDARADD
jgi:hypothetical protein